MRRIISQARLTFQQSCFNILEMKLQNILTLLAKILPFGHMRPALACKRRASQRPGRSVYHRIGFKKRFHGCDRRQQLRQVRRKYCMLNRRDYSNGAQLTRWEMRRSR